MKIPDAALQKFIAVLGKIGSGKTFAVKGLVEHLLEQGRRVGIVDPTGAWWGLRSSRDGKSKGFPILVLGGDHGDLPLPALGGAAVARLLADGVNLVADTSQLTVGERTRWFIDFAGTLYRANKTPLHLVIDEAHNFAPQGKVIDPDSGKMLHAANQIATGGRSRGLRLTVITQRPQKLHKDTLTSADTLIAMRVMHPLDRGAVQEWINGCGDPAQGKEVLASLANLATGEGWVWYPEGKFLERLKFPPIKTFDSSATPTDGGTVAAPRAVAEIDLTEIRAAMADAVKEAEANDPKLLRARIAQLEREAKKPAAAPAATAPAPATSSRQDIATIRALRRALGDAMKFIATIKTVGFPEKVDAKKLESAVAAAVERIGAQINAEFEAQRRAFAKWQGEGERLQASIAKLLGDEQIPVEVTVRHNEPFSVQTAPRSSSRVAASPPAEGVSRSQQKILESLALLEGMGIEQPSRTQLALWAEVSSTSGGYFNNLGALRSAGLIDYPSGGTVALTDAGRERAPTPAALSVEEMQDSLCTKVGASKAAIVRALIDLYPKDISRDELAARVDVSATSGGYFNNLGALRTLGVIDYPAPGKVVALPVLFLE